MTEDNKIKIIPAILPADYQELEEKLGQIHGLANMVQVDIMDGTLTVEATWPYKKKDDNFESIMEQNDGMPYWEDINFEFDLMVKKPGDIIEHWITAGASRIVIHIDSDTPEALERVLNEWSPLVEMGICLHMDTPIDQIDRFLNLISFVQLMGIDEIGLQGAHFDNNVINKVAEIKKKTDLPISIDGGVSDLNIKALHDAGVSRVVVGSYIWKADSVNNALDKLNEAIL